MATLSNKSEVVKYCSNWYETHAGKKALEKLDDLCAEVMSEVFGYYAIETGVLSGKHNLLRFSRIAAGFSVVTESANKEVSEIQNTTSVVSTVEQLPIATDNIDLVIASHVLETSDEPHQVLREIDRVLVPDGQCILVGFNPFAISRIFPQMGKLVSRGFKQKGNNYEIRSASRVRDWFSLLGFEVIDVHYMGFRPNIKNKKLFDSFRWLDRVGDYAGPMLGNMYMFHVRKQAIAMRTHKKVWSAPAVLSGGKVVLNNTAQKIRRENYSNL